MSHEAELRKLLEEKNRQDRELTDEEFLFNLSERLMFVPVMYGVDQSDIDRLYGMAAALRDAREDVIVDEDEAPIATTQDDVEWWKKCGIRKGARYLIVVCDTFDLEDYPVYVMPGESLRDTQDKYNQKMQRVMETIDLRPVDPQTGLPTNG